MDKTLDQVKNQAPTMAENTVNEIAINTKLNELEKSNTEIKIPDELLNQIQKDVMIAVKNVENKQDVQALENTIKNLVIKDITNIVKGKTNEVITENVETMKTNITDPTALMSESEKAALNQSKNQIAQAMVPGIKIQYPNLTDEVSNISIQRYNG